jgi:hypothetical protein
MLMLKAGRQVPTTISNSNNNNNSNSPNCYQLKNALFIIVPVEIKEEEEKTWSRPNSEFLFIFEIFIFDEI